MTASRTPIIATAAAAAIALSVAGCGDFAQKGSSPSQIAIMALEGASGATPQIFSGTLSSDVQTFLGTGTSRTGPFVYSDPGRVTMRLILKDPGVPGITATPSLLNQVTITRYHVEYNRADGRSTPGVDVPFPFDSSLTVTVPVDTAITAGFDLVRGTAKREAPLAALVANGALSIATIARVTFYGHDLAGNDVSVSGDIGVTFANFGDPQ